MFLLVMEHVNKYMETFPGDDRRPRGGIMVLYVFQNSCQRNYILRVMLEGVDKNFGWIRHFSRFN